MPKIAGQRPTTSACTPTSIGEFTSASNTGACRVSHFPRSDRPSIGNKLRETPVARAHASGSTSHWVGEPWATDGRLVPGWKDLVKALIRPAAPMRTAVAAEIARQFALCAEHGLDPRTLSHVDSHQHVHAFNHIWQPVLKLAREHNIPRVRVPWCPTFHAMKKNIGGVAPAVDRPRPTSATCRDIYPAWVWQKRAITRLISSPTRFGHRPRRDIELVVHPGVNTPALETRYHDWHFDWTGRAGRAAVETIRRFRRGGGLSVCVNAACWHFYCTLIDMAKSPKTSLKNPEGGLTAAGRKAFKEKEGSNLKPGVKGAVDSPEKMKRKGSFLRRHFATLRGPLVDENGKPTRLALSAHAWGEPVPKTKAAAKKLADKGTKLLERYEKSKSK